VLNLPRARERRRERHQHQKEGYHFPVPEFRRKGLDGSIPISFCWLRINESKHPFILASELFEFSEIFNETELIVAAVELEITRCASCAADA